MLLPWQLIPTPGEQGWFAGANQRGEKYLSHLVQSFTDMQLQPSQMVLIQKCVGTSLMILGKTIFTGFFTTQLFQSIIFTYIRLSWQTENHHSTTADSRYNIMKRFCIVLLACSFALANAKPQYGSSYQTKSQPQKKCKTVFDIEREEKFEKKCETKYV